MPVRPLVRAAKDIPKLLRQYRAWFDEIGSPLSRQEETYLGARARGVDAPMPDPLRSPDAVPDVLPTAPRQLSGFEEWVEQQAQQMKLPESKVRKLQQQPTADLEAAMKRAADRIEPSGADLRGASYADQPASVKAVMDPEAWDAVRQSGALKRTEDLLRAMPSIRWGGAAAGGAVGVATADEDDLGDKVKRGLLGAVAGGAVLPGAVQAVALGRGNAEKLSNYLFYNYLSSPDTIARANLGAVGGVISHVFEQAGLAMTHGVTTPQGKVAARNAIESLKAIPESKDIFWKTLTGKEGEVRELRKRIFGLTEGAAATPGAITEAAFDVNQRFRDVGLGRFFSAGDNAAVHALTRGGLSLPEAMRYTLAGTPETGAGQKLLAGVQDFLKSPSVAKRFAGATLAPFARVGIVGTEQGMKRTPLIGQMFGGSQDLKTVRQGLGLGAGLAGIGAEEMGTGVFDPRITQTLGTAAGPFLLPFQLGREFARARQTTPDMWSSPGQLFGGASKAVGQAALEFSPLGFQPGAMITQFPREIGRRLLPAGLADIAQAADPAYGRGTGGADIRKLVQEGELPGWMGFPGVGGIAAGIPDLRERLPERFAPVDWMGQRLQSRQAAPLFSGVAGAGPVTGALDTILNRTLFPSRAHTVPAARDVTDPTIAALGDVGVQPSIPSSTVGIHPLLRDVPMTPQSASRVQRFRGISNQVAAAVLQQYLPMLSRLPPGEQQRMARYLFAEIKGRLGPITQAASRQAALAGMLGRTT
jgi:hypothetical protein